MPVVYKVQSCYLSPLKPARNMFIDFPYTVTYLQLRCCAKGFLFVPLGYVYHQGQAHFLTCTEGWLGLW